MSDTLIDLIRHGGPVGGRQFRGDRVDDPLSAAGWAQLRAALGEACPWDQVISSPMARCRPFAMEVAARHSLPLAIEPALREIGMGDWERRTPADLAANDPAAFAALYRDPAAHRPPGGEPLAAFTTRVATAYDRLAALYPGRHLLIVCHSGVMRAVVGYLLSAADARWYRLRIDYAGLVRVRHGRFGAAIECVNAPTLPG